MADIKRYTMSELARTTLFMDTEFVRADDHEAAIQAAVAKERAECAELCDRFAAREMHPAECASAIRARGAAHD